MNLEAERGTLSALITIPDFAHTLPFKLSEEDFESITNRVIARTVLQIVEEGQQPNVNLITSTARNLAIDDWDEQTKGGDEIEAIMALSPTGDEAVTYVRQLKKESMKRSARSQLKNLGSYIESTDDSLADILSKFEDTVLSVTSSANFSEDRAVRLADIVEDEINFYGDNEGTGGLDIGFPIWQERIGGIGNGLVHCVIATNKTGKSTIGMNAALETGKHMPVLFIDTEMNESMILVRLVSMITKLPTKLIKDGHWKNVEHDDHKFYNRIQQGVAEFKTRDITYISARGRQVVDLIPQMRRWIIENKVSAEGKFPEGLIIYDYVKLSSFTDMKAYGLQEYQLLGLNMSSLKDFCGKYKVPCITFGQTNRADDTTINCLGASKRIADLVDSVTLFKQKDNELLTKDPNGTHLMRVFVARHGPATAENEHIQFQYNKATGIIGELGIHTWQSAPPEQEEKKWGKKKAKKKHGSDVTTQELLENEFGPNDND